MSEGCSYFANTYLPDIQKNTLKIEYDKFSKEVIELVKGGNNSIPLLSVLVSGRPMIINDIIEDSSAFVSAFLPGSSGGHGIVEALIGNYSFRPGGDSDTRNSLSFNWPRTMVNL